MFFISICCDVLRLFFIDVAKINFPKQFSTLFHSF